MNFPFLDPLMTHGEKQTILPAHIFLCGRKTEAANFKQSAGWKQQKSGVLFQALRGKTVRHIYKRDNKKNAISL